MSGRKDGLVLSEDPLKLTKVSDTVLRPPGPWGKGPRLFLRKLLSGEGRVQGVRRHEQRAAVSYAFLGGE